MNPTTIATPAPRRNPTSTAPRRAAPAAKCGPRTIPQPPKTHLELVADDLHRGVSALTAALEAGDLSAARVARDDVNRARIALDVASAMRGAA